MMDTTIGINEIPINGLLFPFLLFDASNINTKLNLGKSEIVLASTNIYKSNQVPVGYSFTQIPASAFEALDVDISNDSALEDLIEHKIFDVSSKGNMSVQLIASNEEES